MPASTYTFVSALKPRSSWYLLLALNALVAAPLAEPRAAFLPPIVGTDQGSESEPNNTAATADVLVGSAGKIKASLFSGVAGSLGNDTDYFSFTTTVPNSKVYATVINSQSNGGQDSILEVLASDGTTVLELDDQDGSFGAASSSIAGTLLAAPGTYYFRVTNFQATIPMGVYFLYYAVQDPAGLTAETEPNNNGSPQVLPGSGYVSGVIDPLADSDTFTFTANAGDTVFLSQDLDPERDVTTFNGRIGLGIFGTPGSYLVTSDAGTFDTIDSEAEVMTVKTTGTYVVYVDSQVATAGLTQTYNFSLAIIPAAPTGTITTYTNATPTPIGDLALTSSTITIPDSKIIKSLRVIVDITHTNFPDLDVHLRSPADNNNGLFADVGAAAQTGAQNYAMGEEAGLPILFTIVNGANWQARPAYRIHWFKGENTLGTWTLDIRDDTTANTGTLNSWSLQVEEEPAPPGVLVYDQNFESGDGGFTHSGTADEWEYGTPATPAQTVTAPFIAPFLTAASGVSCWKTDLDNTYDASSTQDLVSPTLDMTAYGTPLTLYWQQRYQMDSFSVDHIWVRVTEVGNPSNSRVVWHADNFVMGEVNGAGASLGNLPESAGWGRYKGDISDFAGKQIQVTFHLDSDATVNYGGWAVDDVQVRTEDLCPNDPNKTDPGVCGCGVPDTDSDLDGTPDCNDLCPLDPAKVAPGICGCGVSDADSDGDLVVDCLDGCPFDPALTAPVIWYADSDSDGYGDLATTQLACAQPPGYVSDSTDCDDTNGNVHPGAGEVCGNGIDDNCNGQQDEAIDSDGDGTNDCFDGCPLNPKLLSPAIWYEDTDGDGFGDPAVTQMSCSQPPGYVSGAGDGCPNDPNKIAPGQCGCGVPDTDTDGDLTADCNDQCPTDPNKILPGVCGCGVADTDVDGDGLLDCQDNCPNLANPAQADFDADGVGDGCDNCQRLANPGQEDCNNDGIGDVCAIVAGAPDCNLNGVPDTCDIAGGASFDLNANAIPDECELNGGSPFCFGSSGCPCGNNSSPSERAGCKNATPFGGKLVGVGTTSVSNDNLSLQCSHLTGLIAVIFQSQAITQVPFSDGLKCVSGPLIRIGVGKPVTNGNVSYPIGSQPAVSVKGLVPATGGVRYYQAIYRSNGGPCGTGLNITNGLSVVWQP